jgi:hypothetical protein
MKFVEQEFQMGEEEAFENIFFKDIVAREIKTLEY